MRLAALVALSFIIAAGLITGCGKGRDTNAGISVTGTNEAGLRATVFVTRADDRWFEARLTLENTGKQIILFKNAPGDRIPGFRLAAAGQPPFGANAGIWAKSRAIYLSELIAGGSSELVIKWNFEVPPKPRAGYVWTVTITNLYIGEEKIADIVLSRPANAH